jgi:hypothetical protein
MTTEIVPDLEEYRKMQFKIKQLNHIVAVTTGRLDIVDQYIDKAESNGRPVDYEFKAFVTKSKKNIDEMLKRLVANKPIVE